MTKAHSNLVLSLTLAASAVAAGCSGLIGSPSGNSGNAGSSGNSSGTGSGTGVAGSNGTGNGTGVGGSTGSGTGSAGTTGSAGSGVVVLPNSPLQSGPVLRLANYEFLNSIRDILKFPADAVLEPDAPSTGDFRIGGPAGDNTVNVYHSAAIDLATKALQTLGTVEPCYTTALTGMAAAQTTCANSIIADLGPKFYRRPVDPAAATGLQTVYSTIAGKYGFQAGVQAVLESLIQSPYFLYHLELEEESMGGTATGTEVPVTGYSMASRLSYLIWGSTPDATLMTAAAGGQLSTKAQVAAQVTRMLADSKAVGGVRNFYEQWLKVIDLAEANKAKNTVTNIDYGAKFTSAVQSSIQASFDAQVDDAIWNSPDTIKALLTGTSAWVDVNTAPIFGVTGVTGTTLQKVTVDPTQRMGIMTHPAIMSVFATETSSHPIKRGVFFWDKFLCQPLPSPPPNVPPFVAPSPGQSLRADFETMTADPTACQPCHKRINPVGFLFEHYDSMGYYTSTDSNGQPVVTASTIVGTNDPMLDLATTDAVQFASRLGADDSVVASCMVKQVYRYAAHRIEAGGDATVLKNLTDTFNSSGRSIKALLSAYSQSEGFLNRLNVQ